MKVFNKKVNLLMVLFSGLRHRWLVFFRPRYTISSLLKRKGSCRACGFCCILNKPSCRYIGDDGRCKIYDRQPFFCKVFPIDERDKEMSGVADDCGYRWDDNS